MPKDSKIVSIILAAGKGTRMQAPNIHKVCFPVADKPVIVRSLETYQRCGITAHLLVVGQHAEQVMSTAASVPTQVMFCYQAEQKGTGHAAKIAATLLEQQGYEGDIMLVAGDKVLEEGIVARLLQRFYAQDCELAFVVGHVEHFPASGRIITDEAGAVLGNVEVFDIARMHLLRNLRALLRERPLSPDDAESMALAYFKREDKAAKALGPIWDLIKRGQSIDLGILNDNYGDEDFLLNINGCSHAPELLEHVKYANLSVYLFKAPALYRALKELGANNAQNEEYLTDTIGILAASGAKVAMVPLQYPEEAMAFNTPEELQEIEHYYRVKKNTAVREPQRKTARRASAWHRAFSSADPEALAALSGIYGEGRPTIEIKRHMLVSLLAGYLHKYGDGEVIITRAPSRVNIMGRHVDHQGGMNNHIAIDRDCYMVLGCRDDRTVRISSLEHHHFADRQFNIDAILADYRGETWLDFINGPGVTRRLEAARGDWSQYVIAPIARFQIAYPEVKLAGMNIMVGGNVPIAAGLSSSSTVVVTTAEGLVHLNALDISPERFVELCGEGEWYVGTRGGAGDHAAMKFARRNSVVQVGFFPFRLVDTVSFPPGYMVLVCNSHQRAHKTTGAKDIFNQRVACYQIGRELFKREFPEYADKITHLRDMTPEDLGVDYPTFLAMFKRLPLVMTREEIIDSLGAEACARFFAGHSEQIRDYQIRPVVLYGLAEIMRSRMTPAILERGQIAEFGHWMNVSHNGDRVVQWTSFDTPNPYEVDCSDRALDRMIAEAAEGHPAAPLHLRRGAYACSIPQIDKMVDIALSVDGVMGAQIAGAGLGGCVIVLAKQEAVEPLTQALSRHYYDPHNLDPEIHACYPVEGSGVLAI